MNAKLHNLFLKTILFVTFTFVFATNSIYSNAKEITISIGIDATDIKATGINAEYVGTAYIGKKLNKSDFIVRYKYLSLEGNTMLGKIVSVDDFTIEPDIATSEEVDILVKSEMFKDNVVIHAIPFPVNKNTDKSVPDKEEKNDSKMDIVNTNVSFDYTSAYTEKNEDINRVSHPETGDDNMLLYWYAIFILSIVLSIVAYFKMHNKGDKGLL